MRTYGNTAAVKKAGGSTTVFLSLTLTCMIALLGGLYGSARTAGSGWYAKMVLDSTMDSMMSCYHKEAFERYKLFLLEYDNAAGLQGEMREMADEYYKATPWYELSDRELTVKNVFAITDRHGELFEKEICDYMKTAIWDPDGEGMDFGSMADLFKETEVFGDVAKSYSNDGSAVMKLSKITNQICKAISDASEDIERAKDYLSSDNVGRFDIEIGKAKRNLAKIPGLIQKYKTEAAMARIRLSESDGLRESKLIDMNQEGKDFTDAQKNEYHKYVDEDGTFYMQVMTIEGFPDSAIGILDNAVSLADEISSDYCECDEEDEFCDCEPDYSPVFDVLGNYERPPGFEVKQIDNAAIKELQDTIAMLDGEILNLILPADKKVKKYRINETGLPSKNVSHLPDSETKKNIAAGIAAKPLILKYGSGFFSNYMTSDEFEGEFPYSQEYMICGKPKSEDDLSGAVLRIAGIRMAANYVNTLRDTEKVASAEELAAAITAATPLAAVVFFLIITAWATLDTVLDLQKLMNGEKIPFVGEAGYELDYNGYLRALLLLSTQEKIDYRMMDLMQDTLKKKQPDFMMSSCAARIEADISGKGPYIGVKRSAEREY